MLNFTPSEWAAVEHRLSVPYCIAEALSDWESNDVASVVDLLHAEDLTGAMAVSNVLVGEVLVEAVEGSTYAASAETRSKQAAALRALEGAAKKIGHAFRVSVRVPYY